MALFASTASATRLCAAEGIKEKCFAGTYQPPTLLEANLATGVNWVLNEGFAKLECGVSNISGRQTSGGGGITVAVGFKLESITWGLCTCPKMKTWLALPWSWLITGTGNKDGEFIATPLSLETECGGVPCFYQENPLLAIEGGKPAKLKINFNLMPQKGSGGNCGKPTVLTAEYVFNAPGALYVTKE